MKSNLIDIDVELKAQTEKAVLVNTGDMARDVWIPLSQCEIANTDSAEVYLLTLPEWLALDKGLI